MTRNERCSGLLMEALVMPSAVSRQNASIYLARMPPSIWPECLHLSRQNASIYLARMPPSIWPECLHLSRQNASIYLARMPRPDGGILARYRTSDGGIGHAFEAED